MGKKAKKKMAFGRCSLSLARGLLLACLLSAAVRADRQATHTTSFARVVDLASSSVAISRACLYAQPKKCLKAQPKGKNKHVQAERTAGSYIDKLLADQNPPVMESTGSVGANKNDPVDKNLLHGDEQLFDYTPTMTPLEELRKEEQQAKAEAERPKYRHHRSKQGSLQMRHTEDHSRHRPHRHVVDYKSIKTREGRFEDFVRTDCATKRFKNLDIQEANLEVYAGIPATIKFPTVFPFPDGNFFFLSRLQS